MSEQSRSGNFEQVVLPHLDAAYNVARWLTRNEHDAEDVVQEAYMRAFRFFGSFRGGSARAWLLRIVRNTSYTLLEKNRPQQFAREFDEKLFGPDPRASSPEEIVLRSDSGRLLRQALEKLPKGFREVLIMREFQGMSYKKISQVTGTPLGTVMSRLWRARSGLRQSLTDLENADTLSTSW